MLMWGLFSGIGFSHNFFFPFSACSPFVWYALPRFSLYYADNAEAMAHPFNRLIVHFKYRETNAVCSFVCQREEEKSGL